MDRIGGWVLALPELFRRKTQQAAQWQEARAMREERQETRKIQDELRAKRAPVKIEPPATPPVVEKSDRAKREQQIPLFNVGDGSGIPPLALLDDPKPQPKGYDEKTLETLHDETPSAGVGQHPSADPTQPLGTDALINAGVSEDVPGGTWGCRPSSSARETGRPTTTRRSPSTPRPTPTTA